MHEHIDGVVHSLTYDYCLDGARRATGILGARRVPAPDIRIGAF
ncbi:hypothetical protein [Nocardia sp.]|nr:hypothetical protein [Nocardia sp.]